MKPVCVPCQMFFRIKKSGFYFTEGMPVGPERAPPGKAAPDRWKPYKIWSADRWECPGCAATILSGFGQQPISLQHEPDFTHYMQSLKADQLQVNDC